MRGFSNLESLSEPHRSAPEPQLHRGRGTRVSGQAGPGPQAPSEARAPLEPHPLVPGDVDEDETLDAWQLHFLLLHLQTDLLVQAPGVADLLQPHSHIHALVVEPAGVVRAYSEGGAWPRLRQPQVPVPSTNYCW